MTNWRLPLSDLWFGDEESEAAARVLASRWLSMGPETEALEREFAVALNARHAVAVSSGTAALHLALVALDLRPGAEVVQPALNFVAAANMTVSVGAVPRFVDVASLSDPTLDPGGLERIDTDAVGAIVVMHYGGLAGRMDEIEATATALGVPIVEDACHAVGGRYRGTEVPVGVRGDVACYSFFSNKNLAAGEGGMVVTNRDDVAERVRLLRSHGMTTMSWDRFRGHASRYDVVANGFNYRIDDLRAALARSQLAKLEDGNRRRRRAASRYVETLHALDGWQVVNAHAPTESSWHLLVALAPDVASAGRAREALSAASVQTSLHYPLIADFDAFVGYQDDGLRLSRAFVSRAITLPMHPGLSDDDVDLVATTIGSAAT